MGLVATATRDSLAATETVVWLKLPLLQRLRVCRNWNSDGYSVSARAVQQRTRPVAAVRKLVLASQNGVSGVFLEDVSVIAQTEAVTSCLLTHGLVIFSR